MTTILEAKGITKSFYDPKRIDVLKDVSLSVRAGKSIAICGRSGEGKTTLLHVLGTLEKPDSGQLLIHQTLVTSRNMHDFRRRFIGFIFQSFNLLEDFSAIDNVLMPAKIARFPTDSRSKSYQNAIELLRDVDLLDRMNSPVKFLSGGERQRVAIARALCNDPEIILADEPSGNLDRSNAKRIGEVLLKCVSTKNKCLILVTHDSELADLCEEHYLLKDGIITDL